MQRVVVVGSGEDRLKRMGGKEWMELWKGSGGKDGLSRSGGWGVAQESH